LKSYIYFSDAENVSQREDLMVDGANLGIELKALPIVLPKDPYKLHISGLSDKTTKDCFLSYIEVVSGEEVQSILFGDNANAMVTFLEPPGRTIHYHFIIETQTLCSIKEKQLHSCLVLHH